MEFPYNGMDSFFWYAEQQSWVLKNYGKW
jgi:hypothetical protein